MSLYQDFADRTAQRIAEGVLRPGDKLLSAYDRDKGKNCTYHL